MKMKYCVICNKIFEHYLPHKKTCSKICSYELRKLNISKWGKKHYCKKILKRYCKVCKKQFIAKYNSQYLCSKECKKESLRIYRQLEYRRNRVKYDLKNKLYRQKNIEKVRKYRSKYKKVHRNKINEYQRRYRTILRVKISKNLQKRLWDAMRGKAYSKTLLQLLGCSYLELKQHLESQFKPEMNWNNYGLYGWHIDHILPCCSFDLSNPEEQKICFHYSNLRPLWGIENCKLGGVQRSKYLNK